MADQQRNVSWWDLAETSGLRAWAWGPVANHGQYVGSPTLGGTAGVTMNGTSQYVNVPAHASLDLGDSWVLWCYIKRGATGANRTLMGKGAGGYQLRLDSAGRPQAVRSGGTVLLTAPSALDTNAHTVAARKDGVQVVLYVDGNAVATTGTAPDTTTNTTWPLRLGADTNSSGTAVEFFNGTMLAAALFPAPLPGQVWGPVILPQLSGPANLVDVPAIRTAYRDPADSTTALVTAALPVLVLPGLSQVFGVTQYTWVASGNLTPDSAGQAAIPAQNVAPGSNGTAVPLVIVSYDAGSQPITRYESTAMVDVALARLVPNITLGDNVAFLSDTVAMLPSANGVADGGDVFYRAMTGPGPTDYAPGSTWQATAAGVQAQLPARGAYLAAQAQIVRRT
jgi:hypothetical protein